MGSAASRIGSSLLSSLAFSSFKRSATFKKEVEGDKAAAAAEASAAAEAAAEEEAARQMGRGRPQSAPSLADRAAAEAEALGGEGGLLFASTSHRALAAASPKAASPIAAPARGASPAQLLRQSSGGSGAAAAGEGSRHGSSGLARVADGVPAPGSRTARGRVDFVMQVGGWQGHAGRALSALAPTSSLPTFLPDPRPCRSLPWKTSTSLPCQPTLPTGPALTLRCSCCALCTVSTCSLAPAPEPRRRPPRRRERPRAPKQQRQGCGQPVEAGSPPMHLVAVALSWHVAPSCICQFGQLV